MADPGGPLGFPPLPTWPPEGVSIGAELRRIAEALEAHSRPADARFDDLPDRVRDLEIMADRLTRRLDEIASLAASLAKRDVDRAHADAENSALRERIARLENELSTLRQGYSARPLEREPRG